MIDAFIPKESLVKASEAISAAEIERKDRIRQALVSAGLQNEPLVEKLFATSSQAPSMRRAANVVGKGILADIFTRVADKLDGK